MDKDTFRIGWLLPDILFLHGERGNILALERMAQSLGLNPEVVRIDGDTQFEPMDFSVIFCPPGEIVTLNKAIDFLMPYRAKLEEFIKSGRVVLATGTGAYIFGSRIYREDGSIIKGLDITGCEYKERKYVYGDDICFTTGYCGNDEECFGVQIRMADAFTGEKESFGRLIYGFGNNGNDRSEGVILNNSIFTDVLGPMLVLNPWVTKSLVEKAACCSGLDTHQPDIDMSLEKKSLMSKKKFARNKKTRLTNCL